MKIFLTVKTEKSTSSPIICENLSNRFPHLEWNRSIQGTLSRSTAQFVQGCYPNYETTRGLYTMTKYLHILLFIFNSSWRNLSSFRKWSIGDLKHVLGCNSIVCWFQIEKTILSEKTTATYFPDMVLSNFSYFPNSKRTRFSTNFEREGQIELKKKPKIQCFSNGKLL